MAVCSFQKYLSPSLQCALIVGGTSTKEQIAKLKSGVDIVTGTPGRVLQLVQVFISFFGKYPSFSSDTDKQELQLDLSGIRFYVLDEADRLLDTGNMETIMSCYRQLKKSGPLQVFFLDIFLARTSYRRGK